MRKKKSLASARRKSAPLKKLTAKGRRRAIRSFERIVQYLALCEDESFLVWDSKRSGYRLGPRAIAMILGFREGKKARK